MLKIERFYSLHQVDVWGGVDNWWTFNKSEEVEPKVLLEEGTASEIYAYLLSKGYLDDRLTLNQLVVNNYGEYIEIKLADGMPLYDLYLKEVKTYEGSSFLKSNVKRYAKRKSNNG